MGVYLDVDRALSIMKQLESQVVTMQQNVEMFLSRTRAFSEWDDEVKDRVVVVVEKIKDRIQSVSNRFIQVNKHMGQIAVQYDEYAKRRGGIDE